MNDYFRLIRHSDHAWHDRFFSFVASIFEGGRTFSAWGARGGWVDGYDVFAVGRRRPGSQHGGPADHAVCDQWQGTQRLPDRRSGNACRPPQPRTRAAANEQGFGRARCARSAGYSLCESERARLLSTVRLSQARAKWLHRAYRCASRGHACPKSGPRKANRPRVVG